MDGRIRVNHHAAELRAGKPPSSVTNPFLLKEDGAGGYEFDRQADEQPHRQNQGCRSHNALNVQRPLPHGRPTRRVRTAPAFHVA